MFWYNPEQHTSTDDFHFNEETLIDKFLKFRLNFIMSDSCVQCCKIETLYAVKFQHALAFKLSKSSLDFCEDPHLIYATLSICNTTIPLEVFFHCSKDSPKNLREGLR